MQFTSDQNSTSEQTVYPGLSLTFSGNMQDQTPTDGQIHYVRKYGWLPKFGKNNKNANLENIFHFRKFPDKKQD